MDAVPKCRTYLPVPQVRLLIRLASVATDLATCLDMSQVSQLETFLCSMARLLLREFFAVC